MTRMFDIVTIGGATEDIFFTVDDYTFFEDTKNEPHKTLLAFEYGSKVGVPEVTTAYGGGANNTAVAFTRLGFRVAIIAAVGADSQGHGIVHNLEKNHVSTRFVQTKEKSSTGLSFVIIPPGRDHIIFTHRGANDMIHIGTAEKKLIRRARGVYLTSLAGNWKKILPSIFDSARSIAWNPGRQQISAGLKVLAPYLKKTRVLILNKDEATDLVKSIEKNGIGSNIANPRFLLKELKKYVLGGVVITNGERGAFAYDGETYYRQPIIKAKKVVDTTGVGDAFGASFVAGLKLYNGDVKEALRLAARNSASVVGQLGAQAGLIRK